MSIHGKSTGRKSDDIFGAYLCHKHHFYYDDARENIILLNGSKEWHFMRAMSETLRRLLDAGILK